MAAMSFRSPYCTPIATLARTTPAASKRHTKPTTLTPPPSPSNSKKKVLVPVGLGSEEMEAVILVDVLRRAGAEVLLASVEPQLEIRASLGTKIVADDSISSCSNVIFDLVALPGGMPGSTRLRDCEVLKTITSKQVEEKRLYGAICAAPAVVLHPWGLMRRKQMTGHPAFMHQLPRFWAVTSNLQVSGELTTSRGPGTSFEFALSFVEQMFGSSVAEEIRASLMMHADGRHPREEEFNPVEWSVDHTPQVLVPIANGSEEMEVVMVVDILRRAKVDVVVASVEKSMQILGSQETKLVADKSIDDAAGSIFDAIILPGGFIGSERLHKSKVLKKLLKEQESAGRIYGGICSSPAILQKQGLLKGKRATAHPSVIKKITGEVAEGAGVVIDGRVITSRGLGSAMDFSLAIVNKLFGYTRARNVAEGLAFDYSRS